MRSGGCFAITAYVVFTTCSRDRSTSILSFMPSWSPCTSCACFHFAILLSTRAFLSSRLREEYKSQAARALSLLRVLLLHLGALLPLFVRRIVKIIRLSSSSSSHLRPEHSPSPFVFFRWSSELLLVFSVFLFSIFYFLFVIFFSSEKM